MSLVCLLFAIGFAVWAGLAQAELITYGNYYFLVACSLVAGWMSFLPWRAR